MTVLKWRFPARVVAITDMILTSAAFIVFVLLVTGAFTHNTDKDKETSDLAKKSHSKTVSWFAWLIFGIVAIFAVIQISAAVHLIQATKFAQDVSVSLDKAGTWKNVTLVLLIFNIIALLLGGLYINLIVDVLIRGTFLFVVFKFIKELYLVPDPDLV